MIYNVMTLQPKVYQYKRYLHGMLPMNKQNDTLCIVITQKAYQFIFKNAQQIDI